MRLTKYRDVFSGIIFLILSVIIYTNSFNIQTTIPGRLGAEFMPQVVAIIMGALSMILIIVNLISNFKTMPRDYESKDMVQWKQDIIKTFSLLGSVITYVLILRSVGFVFSSIIFLFMAMMIMSPSGKRKIALFFVLSTTLSIAIYYLFLYAFQLYLPTGLYPF